MSWFVGRITVVPEWEYRFRDSLEEEHREAIKSVLAELEDPALDEEGRAVCAVLLRHLVERSSGQDSVTSCSSRSRSRESCGATSVRPPKRHWL